MYVLNEYMEFGVDTPHIATYNFELVFHLLFSTIYSRESFTHEISAISEDQSNMRRHASGLRKSIPVCQLFCCIIIIIIIKYIWSCHIWQLTYKSWTPNTINQIFQIQKSKIELDPSGQPYAAAAGQADFSSQIRPSLLVGKLLWTRFYVKANNWQFTTNLKAHYDDATDSCWFSCQFGRVTYYY